MINLKLSQYFTGVAIKRLSDVEIDAAVSNQHELNGVAPFRRLLGDKRLEHIGTEFIYFDDFEESMLRADGTLTWYDARANDSKRTEYRLYYTDNTIIRRAEAGDLLLLGLKTDGKALLVVARKASTAENQLASLFDLQQDTLDAVGLARDMDREDIQIDYVSRVILDDLGIEIDESDESFLDLLLQAFPSGFPGTERFSAFARSTLPDLTALDDADMAVLTWMDREEVLFRTLERYLVEERLKQGFGVDVDAFLSYATSLRQRRSARAGRALENHLKAVFDAYAIQYSFNEITEHRSKPDFIFPGIREYRDVAFSADLLIMLGAKRTCKDRWRQVLAEAERIYTKHLFTLEPGISTAQTDEMQGSRLQLVVPQEIHRTYNIDQQAWLMNLAGFLDFVKVTQTSA
jgi:hypothetical protein